MEIIDENHRAFNVAKRGILNAYANAKNSTDLSTHNGAVIVARHHNDVWFDYRVDGWNSILDGVEITSDRLERPLKYVFTEHAERMAIYNAARQGVATDGATMYVCWAACHDCARAIIAAGIKRLVVHKQRMDIDSATWNESIASGNTMFDEAGVEVYHLDANLGVKVLHNGELTEF